MPGSVLRYHVTRTLDSKEGEWETGGLVLLEIPCDLLIGAFPGSPF